MALDDFYSNAVFFLRWLHIMAGIMWIGILYFFNFINAPFQAVIPKELKPQINPPLMLRALWWFRWGAMFTFIFGLMLLLYKYGSADLWMDASGKMTHRSMWILFGALLGTIMWFNVWFIIWPAQKQIITWMKAGQSPAEMPALAKRAGLFSKINTYLSGPMLFCMIAPNNYGAISFPTLLVVIVFSEAVTFGLYKISGKVGQTV